jgi:hypothetical protein
MLMFVAVADYAQQKKTRDALSCILFTLIRSNLMSFVCADGIHLLGIYYLLIVIGYNWDVVTHHGQTKSHLISFV